MMYIIVMYPVLIWFLAYNVFPLALTTIIPALTLTFIFRRLTKNQSKPLPSFKPFALSLTILAIVGNIVWEVFVFNKVYYEWDRIYLPYTFFFHEGPHLFPESLNWSGGDWIAKGWTLQSLNWIWLTLTFSIYIISILIALYYGRKRANYSQYKKIIFLSIISFLVITAIVYGANYFGKYTSLIPKITPLIPQSSTNLTKQNKIFYILSHTVTGGGPAQSKNPVPVKEVYSEIYSLDLTSKQSSLIYSDKGQNFYIQQPGYGSCGSCAVKIDGSRIYFRGENRTYNQNGNNNKGGFFLDINTGNITRDPTFQVPSVTYVSGASDGKLLAFTIDQDIQLKNTTTNIVKDIVNFSTLTNLNLKAPFIRGMSISPDGKHIAVIMDDWTSTAGLFIVNVDTGEVSRTVDTTPSHDPTISYIDTPLWVDNTNLMFRMWKYKTPTIPETYIVDITNKNSLKKLFSGGNIGIPIDAGASMIYGADTHDKVNPDKITATTINKVNFKTGQTEVLKEIPMPYENDFQLTLIY